MIESMTGYGLATQENDHYNINVEIKTLNSKFLDQMIKLPKVFSKKEADVKALITEKLRRGKISMMVEFTPKVIEDANYEINKELFKHQYEELKSLAREIKEEGADLFKMALNFPEVIAPRNDEDTKEEEWKAIMEVIEIAADKCRDFRLKEGAGLLDKLLGNVNEIEQRLIAIEVHDPARVANIKNRINNNLIEFIGKDKIDENRLEQELIYYIEKLDINEEKVRLKSHLEYFREVINSSESQGKKLGFISQEIGREINTIGSKANDATIQRLVVEMKDELEQIKEQLLNIL